MKIQPREIAQFLKKPDSNNIQAVLIYGVDSGLVRERSRAISKELMGEKPDPFNLAEITGDQLKSDPAILRDELGAFSLMGGRRLVVMRDIGDKATSVITSAFENLSTTTYLIIEAEELASSSSLRQLFEKQANFAVIACYHEEGRDLEGLITQTLASFGLRASRDAMVYLSNNLGNDRMITKSELEKIAVYMGQEKEVTLEIAMLLTSNNASESIEDLCHAVALGKPQEAHNLLTHLLHEGVQAVAIIRTLLKHFQKIDLALGYMKSGQSSEQAIKMLRPPVFYKSVPLMEKALARNNASKIATTLNFLLKAEKDLKSSLLPPQLLVSNITQQLSR